MQQSPPPSAPSFADAADARVPWIDVARGVTITLVVLHHVIKGLSTAGLAGAGLTFWHASLTPQMLSLFVLLSGFFSGPLVNGPAGPFLRRIATLLWVYVVWTFVEFLCHMLLAAQTNNVVRWSDLLMIGWRPLFAVWFIYALAIFLVLARVLRRLDPRLRLAIGAALFVGGFFVSSAGDTALLHDAMQLYVYFEAGMTLRRPIVRLIESGSATLSLTLLAAYFGIYALGKQAGIAPTSLFYVALLVFALPAVLIGSVHLACTFAGPTLQLVGRHSLQVYLIHFLPAGAVHVVASRLHLQTHPVVLALGGTVAAVVFSLLLPMILVRVRLGILFRPPQWAAWARPRSDRSGGSPPGPLPPGSAEAVA